MFRTVQRTTISFTVDVTVVFFLRSYGSILSISKSEKFCEKYFLFSSTQYYENNIFKEDTNREVKKSHLVRTAALECAYVHLPTNSVLHHVLGGVILLQPTAIATVAFPDPNTAFSVHQLDCSLTICLSSSKALQMAEDLNLVDEEYITRMTGFEADCNDGKGDPMACHQVGEFFSLVKDDSVRAGKVYEKNCTDKNYSASCFNLAKLYMTGKGVTQSDEKAESFFKQSCTGGHLYGCYHQVASL